MISFARVFTIILSILVLNVFPVKAEILRCKGKYLDNTFIKQPESFNVHIDIVIPEKFGDAERIVLLSEKGVAKELLGMGKIGKIEIGVSIGEGVTKAHKYTRYDLIVTRMPNKEVQNSLVGFFINRPWFTHVSSIRVDVWDKGMPFYLYETGFNQISTGKCE